MMNVLSRSSRFLVGVATAIICLRFLVCDAVPYPDENVDAFTFANHLAIWLHHGMGSLMALAEMLLAGWIGQLLQRVIPNRSRAFRFLLICLAALCFALYIWASCVYYLPPHFAGCRLAIAMILGFLMHPEHIQRHDMAELIAIVVILAFSYVALTSSAMMRHRWTDLPLALAFVWFTILLANAKNVQQLMGGRWVTPAVAVLSVLSFVAAIWYFIECFNWLSFGYLLPGWFVLIQPLVVYTFIRLWRVKHE